jgi:hypothetical protein
LLPIFLLSLEYTYRAFLSYLLSLCPTRVRDEKRKDRKRVAKNDERVKRKGYRGVRKGTVTSDEGWENTHYRLERRGEGKGERRKRVSMKGELNRDGEDGLACFDGGGGRPSPKASML